jgi:hypothetical protein
MAILGSNPPARPTPEASAEHREWKPEVGFCAEPACFAERGLPSAALPCPVRCSDAVEADRARAVSAERERRALEGLLDDLSGCAANLHLRGLGDQAEPLLGAAFDTVRERLAALESA